MLYFTSLYIILSRISQISNIIHFNGKENFIIDANKLFQKLLYYVHDQDVRVVQINNFDTHYFSSLMLIIKVKEFSRRGIK
jgi:hypothetical protein